MHQLSFVHISNFRGCREVSLPLQSFTPLVGQNNTGKSTILEAIQWAIKPSALKENDFADPNEPAVVTLRVDGISQEIIQRIPEQRHRTAIGPYCRDGVIWIRVVGASSGPAANRKKQEVFDHEAHDGNGMPQDWREYPTGLPQAVSALFPEPLFIDAMEDLSDDLGKAKAGSTIKALLDELMGPIVAAHDDLQTALSTMRGMVVPHRVV